MTNTIKLGFFGTPEISAYVLQELFNAGFNISWVVTQPDRKAGRGLKVAPPPVKTKAQELGIKVFQSEKFDRDVFNKVSSEAVNLSVVVAYGSYIPSYFINSSALAPLNIHTSFLPKYRGAAPVARAIMSGENTTGVTIMKLAKQMDTGDIVVQKEIEISQEDDSNSLTWKLVREGTELLISTIPLYLVGKMDVVEQSQTNVEPSYAEKITTEDKKIDWNKSAKELHNKVRALYPWPVAEAMINNIDIKIIKTGWSSCQSVGKPGDIIDVSRKENKIAVSTCDGVLLIEKVQPFGKREMTISEFINGHKIEKGMRFENV